jgi:hypothetical protein
MPKNAQTIIDHLSPDDALAILGILAREDDRLGAHIAEVVTSYLSCADPGEIASMRSTCRRYGIKPGRVAPAT